ncbi:Atxe2 family lasso peptide isopeptidase [Sphingomonas sp. 1185]|uniref:Atxe2 family lasso peptide isopeptidase n=1 Tax=Sphingomonas sp. 1185 TaxID=3156411 RepID=UPI00339952B7
MAAPASPRVDTGCADLLPSGPAIKRSINPMMLARVRDIGSVGDQAAGPGPLAISPDGSMVAFALRRADPVTNRYCTGLILLPLRRGARPVIIDAGGDVIPAEADYLGMADYPMGRQVSVEPKWAPDGRSIAFLKRRDGTTQIWLAFADGRAARALTRSANDVGQPFWSADGRSVIYRVRPGLVAAGQMVEEEGRGGYRYDSRIFAAGSAKPFPRADIPFVWMASSISESRARPIDGTERDLAVGPPVGVPAKAALWAVQGNRLAWSEAVQPYALQPQLRIRIRLGDRETRCASLACSGDLEGMWWRSDGSLVFLRSEGVGDGESTFYLWKPGSGEPHVIRKDDTLFIGCQMLAQNLLCLRETPTRPRQIVRVDTQTGRIVTVFDPNPEFANAVHGRVERLTWSDPRGGSTFGYLVLPPHHRPGDRLPLVVVQYSARGFQRGGVGDEVPIFPLAQAGFAVLNFQRPHDRSALIRNHNVDEYMREEMGNWKDRRDVLASLEAGVNLLIDRGIVDRARVGLSGLSDGAETTQFALIHSKLFAAASISTCCKDPVAFTALAGPAQWAAQERWGLRPYSDSNRQQWLDASLALNADRIKTPILLQLADWEFRLALQTISEFQRRDRPIEVRLFPSEHHIKDQPAHRLALYDRNIAWFSKWLHPNP